MITVNIHQAKTNLSKLLVAVSLGEEVIIAKAGTPIAVIKPITQSKPKRKPGSMKGKIKISDDFDDPLPDDLLKLFYEGGIFPKTKLEK
jgi:prevent-host-death family protein